VAYSTGSGTGVSGYRGASARYRLDLVALGFAIAALLGVLCSYLPCRDNFVQFLLLEMGRKSLRPGNELIHSLCITAEIARLIRG
jgi:hypothetical protein